MYGQGGVIGMMTVAGGAVGAVAASSLFLLGPIAEPILSLIGGISVAATPFVYGKMAKTSYKEAEFYQNNYAGGFKEAFKDDFSLKATLYTLAIGVGVAGPLLMGEPLASTLSVYGGLSMIGAGGVLANKKAEDMCQKTIDKMEAYEMQKEENKEKCFQEIPNYTISQDGEVKLNDDKYISAEDKTFSEATLHETNYEREYND